MTVTRDNHVTALALATLGGTTQIEMILSLSYRPRWPRKVSSNWHCCQRYRANFLQWKHNFSDQIFSAIISFIFSLQGFEPLIIESRVKCSATVLQKITLTTFYTIYHGLSIYTSMEHSLLSLEHLALGLNFLDTLSDI